MTADLQRFPTRPAGRDVRAPLALFCCLALAVAAALSVIAFASPAAAAAMEFTRAGFRDGEVYRLLTAHFAHFTASHLAWDLATFLVLAGLIIQRDPRKFFATFVIAAPAISLGIFVLNPQIHTYRGLSGIDSALFGCAAMLMFREAGLARSVAILALAGFVAKTGYELASGQTLFVSDLGANVTAVPLAHILGCGTGLLVGALRQNSSRRLQKDSAQPVRLM